MNSKVVPSSLPSAGAPPAGATNVVILVTLNTAILIGTTPVRAVLLAAPNPAEMNGLEDILYPDATNVESLVGRNVTKISRSVKKRRSTQQSASMAKINEAVEMILEAE
jgi:hypothetical protein